MEANQPTIETIQPSTNNQPIQPTTAQQQSSTTVQTLSSTTTQPLSSTTTAQTLQTIALIVPSKKIQVNSHQHQLLLELTNNMGQLERVSCIKIEGNSYSLQFCEWFGQLLGKAQNIKDLNINDIFVSRLKQEIPKSIEYISSGLKGSNLLRLDISNNAVNPFGAEALLTYLNQATSLQVLLIYNCGLGALGTQKIANGLKGTPNLRTLSIARNRMTDPGIISIASNLHHVPLLEELFVYQNTLKEGLELLFNNLAQHCHQLTSLDVCDNFIRNKATQKLGQLLSTTQSLRNINLSDCLVEAQNEQVITAFEQSKNRGWQRIGYNYAQLDEQLALRLLQFAKSCPLKRLDITGNEFGKKVKKAFTNAFVVVGVLSVFDDEQDEQLLRLFEQLKI